MPFAHVPYFLHFTGKASNGESALPESTGPTGKRSARKRACSVWSGGKAVRPYLSLPCYSVKIGGVPQVSKIAARFVEPSRLILVGTVERSISARSYPKTSSPLSYHPD